VLTLLAITLGALYYSFSRVDKEATFETDTTRTLSDIAKRLDKIDTALSLAQLEKITANPIDKTSAFAAQKLIADAQAQSIKLPADALEQAGKKLVAASTNEPMAWDAAMDFLNYRSSNNVFPKQIPESDIKIALITEYGMFSPPPGMAIPQIAHSAQIVPREVAAQLNQIGIDFNKDNPKGAAFLIALGGGAIIDGMQLRNVIFHNVHIFYNGGPLIMTNVYFVNCTFEMKSSKNSKNLALAALAPTPETTFTASVVPATHS
jgi:hypothetical protein